LFLSIYRVIDSVIRENTQSRSIICEILDSLFICGIIDGLIEIPAKRFVCVPALTVPIHFDGTNSINIYAIPLAGSVRAALRIA